MRTPSLVELAAPLGVWAASLWALDKALAAVVRLAPVARHRAIGVGSAVVSAAIVIGLLGAFRWRAGDCSHYSETNLDWSPGALAVAWLLGRQGGRAVSRPWARVTAAGSRWVAAAFLALLVAAESFSLPPTHRREAQVVGLMRTWIAAERAHRSLAGTYASVKCLRKPQACLPGYRGDPFLDSFRDWPQYGGYVWGFHPDLPASAQRGADRSGFSAVALTAVPIERRVDLCCSFCGDSSGRVCFRRDGTPPAVASGQCAEGCEPIDAHTY
jgi:hypothetical protein